MNSIAGWFGAIGLMLAAAAYPQKSEAESFTGTEFLGWPETEQRGYVSAQIVMASSIVAREKPTMAQCISDKFYGERGLTQAGFDKIQGAINEYRTYHPSSVVVILIENACGRFY